MYKIIQLKVVIQLRIKNRIMRPAKLIKRKWGKEKRRVFCVGGCETPVWQHIFMIWNSRGAKCKNCTVPTSCICKRSVFHREVIAKYGITQHHRKTFALANTQPVLDFLVDAVMVVSL